MGNKCLLQGPQCCGAAVPLGGVSGGSQVQCVSGSVQGGMESTVTLWRVENLALVFLNLSLSMTSLRCSCCMQVSVCVCWWFKKFLAETSLLVMSFFGGVLLCSAGYKETCDCMFQSIKKLNTVES